MNTYLSQIVTEYLLQTQTKLVNPKSFKIHGVPSAILPIDNNKVQMDINLDIIVLYWMSFLISFLMWTINEGEMYSKNWINDKTLFVFVYTVE